MLFSLAGFVLLQSVRSQDNNLSFEGSVTLENVNNLSGGIKKGSVLMALLDVSAGYQAKESIFRNTEFFFHFLKTAGKPASGNLIGDVQVASNIEGTSSLFFYELWLKQNIGSFSLLAGMHDLNTTFLVSDHAGLFLNSSFGISPAITLNMPVSIFPVTTFGTNFSFEKEKFTFISGFYNHNYEFVAEESFHIKNHFFKKGFFFINEVQYRFGKNSSTQMKMGMFMKKCSIDTVDIYEGCLSAKNYGGYFFADHTFYKNSASEKSVNGFVQINLNPQKINFASQYTGIGLTFEGFISKKHTDIFGLSVARVKLNQLNELNEYVNGDYETAIELTARFVIFKKLTVQPDLQYIIHPGGVLSNALTGMLRVSYQIN